MYMFTNLFYLSMYVRYMQVFDVQISRRGGNILLIILILIYIVVVLYLAKLLYNDMCIPTIYFHPINVQFGFCTRFSGWNITKITLFSINSIS